MPSKLHVWHNDHDWVIATDEADATAVYRDFSGDESDLEWEKWADGRSLTVINDDDSVQTRTCAEWVRKQGRGYLCSEDY